MEPQSLFISNVNVFDSVNGRITGPLDVAISEGLITSVTQAGSTQRRGVTIDGTGKTLIPGLIDAHWHMMFTTVPAAVAQLSEVGYVYARAVVGAEQTLQ